MACLASPDYPQNDPGGRTKYDVGLLARRSDTAAQDKEFISSRNALCLPTGNTRATLSSTGPRFPHAAETPAAGRSLRPNVGRQLPLEQCDLVLEEKLALLESLQLELILGGA
jgi:hypothetical protein